jgi:tol-pal system protein YbgF
VKVKDLRAASLLWGAVCMASWLAAGCASTPPEEDPVHIKLNDLDTRLARIERVVSNQSLLEMANQLESLRSDVRAMHNDVDVLNHSLDAARKQQHDLYADLDARLKAVEARGTAANAGAAAGGLAAGGGAPGAGDPQADADKRAYQTSFDLLKAGQYDRAISGFQAFLTTFPNSMLADNAQYWLGEAYYVNRQFQESLAEFQRVVDKFPQSRKVPDALLKIGYCDYELKDYSAARSALEQVAARFPDAAAAPLAQQRLEKMAAERH